MNYGNQDVGDIPDKRFGHTMNICGNKLIVMAGAGPILPKMKSRKSYSDLRMMDLCKVLDVFSCRNAYLD